MSYIDLIILAIGLCFDTFAVSITGGISLINLSLKQKLKIISVFGIFQSSFLFAGWLIGSSFARAITQWDHWLAFFILLYLGIKMILESIKEEDCNCEQGFSSNTKVDLLNTKKLCVLAVATSIDAVAVGVSLAFIFLPIVKIGFVTLSTAIITALASYIGVKWGQKLGCAIGKKAELFGGFILILIGIKILIEHLFFA